MYFVDLAPVVGHEIAGGYKRPVAVLSIDDINRKPLVVAVVPGTSVRPSRVYRNVVEVLPTRSNGLSSSTYFQCHQIRAIDHVRFENPPVGILSARDLDRIAECVAWCLGLSTPWLPSA